MNETPSSTTLKVPKSENSWLNFGLFSVFCAFLIGFLTWVTDSNSPLESLNPYPSNSYYNLLVRGFQFGQLNLKINTPSEFAKLRDPYNQIHIWGAGYWADKLDMSYHNGKFYLYFGPTPALVVFWPYAALTGHFLTDRCAVAIFFAFGFLVMWLILCAIQRRYFAETGFGIFPPAIFILGLLLCLVQSGSVHDVAKVSGFSFVLLALAGIWLTMHWPERRNWFLLMASLSYGLAIGARQSLLFGAVILLIPVFQLWVEAPRAVPRRQIAISFLSAFGPIALIGVGLMVYNDRRFGSPFEFGRRYMLTADYESTTAKQLSLHYLWFNIRYYFLEPIHANFHFPFLQDVPLPPPPSGHTSGFSEYGGILFNYPFLLLIFALPLVWRNRPMRKISALSWFILALFLLFVTCVLTDCCFLSSNMSYTLDFLPPLQLLAFIGFLGWDKVNALLPNRRWAIRLLWYLSLGFSLEFNKFVNVKARAYSYESAGHNLIDLNQPDAALENLKNAVSLEPRLATYHDQLACAYADSTKHQNGQAVRELQMALRIDPNYANAEYNLARLLYLNGQNQEAFKCFEMALNLDAKTNDLCAFNNIYSAWLLVFNANPSQRNGTLAIKLARVACQETGYKDAHTLMVAAEVFGENGQTNEAISLAQKTIVVENQRGDTNCLARAKLLLSTYLNNKRLLSPDRTDSATEKENWGDKNTGFMGNKVLHTD
jgi:hypothetical protein